MTNIPPALILYIESYSDSTAQLNAVAGALFAGAAFLTVRAAGVIKDDALPALKWHWLPVGVMVLAGLSMMMGYFVYGQTAYFYSSIYRFELNGFVAEFDEETACRTISNTQKFFNDCIRGASLSTIFGIQIGSVFLSGVLMLVWFGVNSGGKNE